MRTTVTLDAGSEQITRRRMAERGLTFKEALNDAIRRSARDASKKEPLHTRTASLGTSSVNLDRAVALTGALEDDELLRKVHMDQ